MSPLSNILFEDPGLSFLRLLQREVSKSWSLVISIKKHPIHIAQTPQAESPTGPHVPTCEDHMPAEVDGEFRLGLLWIAIRQI